MFSFVLTVCLCVQVCSACQQTGAIMGCFQKGCPRSYHYRCATQSGTVWNTGPKHLSAIGIVIVCFILVFLVFESLPVYLKCRSLTHRASLRCQSHSTWNLWWTFWSVCFSGCVLNEDNFSIRCPEHKVKRNVWVWGAERPLGVTSVTFMLLEGLLLHTVLVVLGGFFCWHNNNHKIL